MDIARVGQKGYRYGSGCQVVDYQVEQRCRSPWLQCTANGRNGES